jgi:glycosyltransferase involved in cell wall biosynthesis
VTGPHVVIWLQNLPLGRDARVKRECRALLGAGYEVTVICPRGEGRDPVPGVVLRAYPPPPEATSAAGFVVEYAWSLLATAVLTLRTAFSHRIEVVQACNPPDLFWPLALPLKARGSRFVFDHHDLSPELWSARSGRSSGLVSRALLLMERLTFATADHVVATNESVRRVALERGRCSDDSVTVVRNGPELRRLDALRPRRRSEVRRELLVVWLGVVGIDDGVEDALRAIRLLVHDHGRTDNRFVFIGDGERLEHCRRLCADLGIEPWVRFTGWLEQDEVFDLLATADCALAPDPPGERAHRATLMKVMEYMAAGLPVVAYDVHETRVSAGDAAVYADEGPDGFARTLASLLDDPERRASMGAIGRRRIRDGLSWDQQELAYLKVYGDLVQAAR